VQSGRFLFVPIDIGTARRTAGRHSQTAAELSPGAAAAALHARTSAGAESLLALAALERTGFRSAAFAAPHRSPGLGTMPALAALHARSSTMPKTVPFFFGVEASWSGRRHFIPGRSRALCGSK